MSNRPAISMYLRAVEALGLSAVLSEPPPEQEIGRIIEHAKTARFAFIMCLLDGSGHSVFNPIQPIHRLVLRLDLRPHGLKITYS